jgi:hypothetical protein
MTAFAADIDFEGPFEATSPVDLEVLPQAESASNDTTTRLIPKRLMRLETTDHKV